MDKLYITRVTLKVSGSQTHLGWSGGIGLRLRSVFLLNVSCSILPGVNLDGLIYTHDEMISDFKLYRHLYYINLRLFFKSLYGNDFLFFWC